jgi:hypothetical protein
MPIDIVGIKTKIAAQLVDDLGLYTAPDGSTVPAIYLVNNVDVDPPRDWKISGIECLVFRNIDRVPQACFGGVADKYQVAVNLIQHSKSQSLNNAIEVLFSHWQRIRVAWHRPQTEEDFEQIKLFIPSQQYFKVVN